jgi:hypothetical protein
MKMYHDWYELASAMSPYSVGVDGDPKEKAWSELCLYYNKKTDPSKDAEGFAGLLIDSFIELHGDANIRLPYAVKVSWNEEIKGTGSPNKKKHL